MKITVLNARNKQTNDIFFDILYHLQGPKEKTLKNRLLFVLSVLKKTNYWKHLSQIKNQNWL